MVSTALDLRALLHREAIVEPVQQIFDQRLVMAKDIVKQSVDAEVINFWREQNTQGRKTKREPGPWDLGTSEWPEVTITELKQSTARLGSKALKVRVTASQLEFATGNIDLEDSVNLAIRGIAERIEKDAFKAYTNDRSTTKGTEFDNALSEAAGGYATSGGHIVVAATADKEWNKGGDALQQLREITTVIENQERISNTDFQNSGEVAATGNYIGYLGGLLWGDLHDQMREYGIDPKQGSAPGRISIPGLYGIEFALANFAITNNGDLLVVDKGVRPVVGYYHVYQRLADLGFTTAQNETGFPVQIKDEDLNNGDAQVLMATGYEFVNRKPKHVALCTGFHANV